MPTEFSAQRPPLNPILVEAWRGNEIESVHRGAACVIDSSGAIRASWGEIDRPIFPRSAVKMIQALPLIETGAADYFHLTNTEIALACASHNGEPRHVQAVDEWLMRIGVGPAALECGCHQPLNEQAALDLAASHQLPTVLHNNCSGKHAGFVTTALHLAIPTRDYVDSRHPIQQHVSAALAEMTDYDLASARSGIDGCGIPTYAIPLRSLARAMAKFALPSSLSNRRTDAIRRIFQAMVARPWFIGGSARFDTEVMQINAGQLVVKMGAEGVHVALHPASGLGVALKIDDGARRAADAAMSAILHFLGFIDVPAPNPILNNRGEIVGILRAIFPHPA
jgi:L-asparaginase II